MKLWAGLSWLSDLFNPPEIRRKMRLQKQWSELDDIPAILQDKGGVGTIVEDNEEEDEEDKLRAEMNMLLDGVVSDIKRIKDIANRLHIDESQAFLPEE